MTIAVLIITVVFALLFFFCLFSKRGIGAIFSVCGCIGGILNLIGFYEVNKPVFFIVGWILVAIGAIGIIIVMIKGLEIKKSEVITIIIVLAIIAIIAIPIVWGFIDDDGDKWNSLSDEEKEWYIDNYGDGQYDEIQDAISDYRGY